MSSILDELKKAGASLFQRGRKGVDTLAVAIDQRAEIARLAAVVRRLNGERDDRVTQIGKKVYSLHVRDKVANPDIASDCRRIDEINAEIAALREQIDRLRHAAAADTVVVELVDETPLGGETAAAPAGSAAPAPAAPEAPVAPPPPPPPPPAAPASSAVSAEPASSRPADPGLDGEDDGDGF